LLPPRSNLVGYMRWHARSDSAFIPPSDNPSNSFQFANGQPFLNPVREGLPTTRPEPHLKLPTPFLDHEGRLSGTRLRVAATKSPRQAHAVQYFLEVRV
jgi:hypothetical protein